MTVWVYLILAALAVFLALKFVRLFLGRPQGGEPAGRDVGRASPPRADPWQGLRDGSSGGPAGPDGAVRHAAGGPDIRLAGFDQEDFLRAARALYIRLQESWDRRDVDDIAAFATQAIINEVRTQAELDPAPSKAEILLVKASLVSAERDGDEDVVSVYFDVLLRENQDAQVPSQIRELWHFIRPAGSAESWRLDGIQQIT